MRSLRADGFGHIAASLVIGTVVLGGWGAWMLRSRVVVYEVSESARLEVDRASHTVQAPVAGRIITTELVLGRHVESGDVLVTLDSEPERLQLAEARARLSALEPQLAALGKEVAAHSRAEHDVGASMPAAVGEARAKWEQAEALARLAEEQLARTRELVKNGLASAAELERQQAEAAERRSAANAARLAIGRTEWEKRTESSDRAARTQSLERELAALQGDVRITTAAVERLQHEIDRRTVRAAVAGTLAEVVRVTAGSVVAEGDRLAAVVPEGELKVIAEFDPPAALGRIHAGQTALVRLAGFPWTQYGTLGATVSRVGGELHEGRVRVELAVVPDSSSTIPLQHGLPGTVEVEVEQVAPWVLALRGAGWLAAAHPRPAGEGEARGASGTGRLDAAGSPAPSSSPRSP